MSDLPNLVWLRAFEAAARLQSFTAAAEELGLTQAAVSHQVRSLEKSFGITLFIRRARHLELTQLGHAYYPSVAQALTDIAYSTRGLLGHAQTRTVTLRAPVSTAVLWLAPRLGAFHSAHPHIRIRLISAVWADSTQDEDVEIDLRLGPSGWFDRRAHLLATESVIPVAQPQLAEQLKSVDQLFGQTLIHIHGYQDHWLRLSEQTGVPLKDRSAPLYVDTSLAAIEMAASGAGVAMLMRRYAELPLSLGRLAPVAGAEIPMGQGHYLMPAAGEAPNSAEVAMVRDWVVSLFC
ncbi:LysR family transcriptional regulator [Leisingera sp. JC1]|uniref:LysR family transcriptional regulator n=1 Tax=Leisingera sp. JC1 TaxID=1855282 RepID=UPI000802F45B|nr:LysR family transcriptional regulator [Leisingera sp. JC1]OBY24435.1 LysR family transcriptional regulator [Leisingera sp. JC1]